MITLGSLLKITKVLQIVRLLFFYDKRRVIILTKIKENVVGYLMGHFLTNSSGHPAAAAMARSKVFWVLHLPTTYKQTTLLRVFLTVFVTSTHLSTTWAMSCT
jgi:hypothetical protein